MKVLVATHGHCFDGLCSAAIFTALIRQLHPTATFRYVACGYGLGQPTPTEGSLVGDINAILDYRFTASERLTWYFDHHRTAFATAEDRAFFERRAQQSDRFHFDADYGSCTQLIYDVARERFGLIGNFDDLVRWADRIDTASFDSAEAAISKSDPLMQLVSVVEHHGGDGFIERFVPELLTRPLSEVAKEREVQKRFAPIGKRHQRFIEAVQHKAEVRGRVIYVDLTENQRDLIGKFVTYALFPQSVYSVVVAQLRQGFKISVGYNPWSGHTLDADISSICERYGGGGHSAVGGITVKQRDEAQLIATHIAQELS